MVGQGQEDDWLSGQRGWKGRKQHTFLKRALKVGSLQDSLININVAYLRWNVNSIYFKQAFFHLLDVVVSFVAICLQVWDLSEEEEFSSMEAE